MNKISPIQTADLLTKDIHYIYFSSWVNTSRWLDKLDLEEKFNKIVNNLSKNDKEFKDCIDWGYVGGSNEELLRDNLEGIFDED